ncbi:MAG: VCBS repeat-containing protein [Candidatus Altiarchaeota archaeon]|nr:VCBS repeat-containing protein [Candidatus Altiarchaeota archaeon]
MEKKTLSYILLLIFLLSTGASSAEDLLSLDWKYDVGGFALYVDSLRNAEGGVDVIVGCSYSTGAGAAGWITALDSKGERLWEKRGFPRVSSMKVVDLDKDGEDEVLLGVLHYIQCYDAKGNRRWNIGTGVGNIITSIEAADLDGDGLKEIVVGGDSTVYPNLYVLGNDGKILWKIRAGAYEVNDVALGDTNGDGKMEIAVGTVAKHGIYYTPSRVYLYDSRGNRMWEKLIPRGTATIELADIEGDGKLEVLVGSLHYFKVLDHQGNSLMDFETRGYIRDIIVEDIDLDGENEILLGSNDLYVLDSECNAKWENPAGTDVINDIEILDLNSDDYPEILVASDGLYIVDYNGDTIWQYSTEKEVKDIHVNDLDGDSFPEVAAGSLDNYVYDFTSTIYQTRIKARNYYSEAKKYYSSGRLKEAMDNILKSKDYYQQLGNGGGVSDADRLISLINSASNKKIEERELAHTYYTNSMDSYLREDYVNATYWARKAQYKFDLLSNDSMAAKSEEIVTNSLRFMERDADESFTKALSYHNSSNHTLVLSNAQEAYGRYVQLGYVNETTVVLELAAGTYTSMAKEQRASGDFQNASISAQKALYIYKCIDSSVEGYPPECLPNDVDIKDVSLLAGEIRNLTYEGSAYTNESLQLKSIILAASQNDTGIYSFSLDFITRPVSGSLDYAVNFISWNTNILTLLVALLIVSSMFVVLYSLLSRQGMVPPVRYVSDLSLKIPKRKTKSSHSTGERLEFGGFDSVDEIGREVREVDKIKKDSRKGRGVNLDSLRDLGEV